jgi:galactokinase
VRSFNWLFHLQLSEEQEMEIAYLGERLTGSECGRMDQCVAFGKTCVSMIFDGPRISCSRVQLPRGSSLHFVVADLCASKDTKRILHALNGCFHRVRGSRADASSALNEPTADDDAAAIKFLQLDSKVFVDAAVAAVSLADAKQLGTLFSQYQSAFDEALIPVCSDQLSSPRLHEILRDDEVRSLSLGGKGIGSQGDGSVQFVCAGQQQQQCLTAVLQSKGCHAFAFTIHGVA